MTDKAPASTQTPSDPTSQDQDLNLEELPSPTSQGTQDGSGSEPTPVGEGEEIVVQPVEGAREFTHPLLKGKSPEEIERLVELQQRSLSDQNTELNTLHSRLQAQPTAPVPTPAEPEDDGYGDGFLAPHMRTLESRLHNTLKQMVDPLIEQKAVEGNRGARERFRQTKPHFAVLEPHVDRLLREKGISPERAEPQDIELLYHVALGFATSNGINLNEASEAPAPTTTREAPVNPPAPPQHRPSTAPLPRSTETTPRRALSENEKLLAKTYYPSHPDPEGEYLKMMDANEDEIVKPGFSAERW